MSGIRLLTGGIFAQEAQRTQGGTCAQPAGQIDALAARDGATTCDGTPGGAATRDGAARTIALLGASGSIGQQATKLLAGRSDVRVRVLSGGRNAAALQRSIDALRPEIVLADAAICQQLRAPKVLPNTDTAAVIAAEPLDAVLNATSGFAGLAASLAAARAGAPLLLANKESLVIAAHLLAAAGATIAPIDSEHSALAALAAGCTHPEQLIITASGGAFRDWPAERIAAATSADALRHPNWAMGAKITVDSASMANKLYELAEARALFGTAKIDAFIERSSVVHAAVRAQDGSLRMYASAPDMALAIASALFGEADFATCARLELAELAALRFEPICPARYPLWALKDELLARPELGVVINAADEAAVGAFLRGECAFGGIARTVLAAAERFGDMGAGGDYAALCEADAAVRAWAGEFLRGQRA